LSCLPFLSLDSISAATKTFSQVEIGKNDFGGNGDGKLRESFSIRKYLCLPPGRRKGKKSLV